MSWRLEPIATPSAAKTMAISSMKRMASGTRVRLVGRNPAIRQTITISVPWNIDTVAPPRVRPIITKRRGTGATIVSFKKPNWRSHSRAAGEHRREQHHHSDHARRHELQVAAASRLLEHRSQPESQYQQIEQRLPHRGDDLRPRP